jgi:hypothetical protein
MLGIGTNGGLIGPRRVPSTGSASGVWDLEEQKLAKGAGIWPLPGLFYSNFVIAALPNGSPGGSFYPPASNPSHGFDGNPLTGVACDTGSILLFTPPDPIPFNTSLLIYGLESGGLYDYVILNGGAVTYPNGSGVVEFSGPGTLASLRFEDRPTTYYPAGFSRIVVDGVELLDPT